MKQKILLVSIGNGEQLANLRCCLERMDVDFQICVWEPTPIMNVGFFKRFYDFQPDLIHLVIDEGRPESFGNQVWKRYQKLFVFTQLVALKKMFKKPLCVTSSGASLADRILAFASDGIEISDIAHRARLRKFNGNVIWQTRNRENAGDDHSVNQLSRYYVHVLSSF
ncbi:MAG: hypothetical protein NZ480_05435 [Bdellovibrionaceae bacterium]|nr:hypothetical protein [Pseudobdellovibrionaceae bacterium]MDW8190463.1 hypothetical protein [Pseudobdellovibrionaceae bacterium]